MDIYTATEEAYKRGQEAGRRLAWHYAKDEPFRPDPEKYYCVRSVIGHDTEGRPVLSGPITVRYGGSVSQVPAYYCWFEIPEAAP